MTLDQPCARRRQRKSSGCGLKKPVSGPAQRARSGRRTGQPPFHRPRSPKCPAHPPRPRPRPGRGHAPRARWSARHPPVFGPGLPAAWRNSPPAAHFAQPCSQTARVCPRPCTGAAGSRMARRQPSEANRSRPGRRPGRTRTASRARHQVWPQTTRGHHSSG